MTRNMSTDERAQELVKMVLRDTFGQKVDDKTVRSVAKKVAKTVDLEEPPKDE